MNPVVIGLIAQLVPLTIDAITDIVNAFSRDELDNMTQEQADAIIKSREADILAARSRRRAELEKD